MTNSETETAGAVRTAAESIATDGWAKLTGVLQLQEVETIIAGCEAALIGVGDNMRVGDKPHAGTRRLVGANERVPQLRNLLAHPTISGLVNEVLGPGARCHEFTYRSPGPGFGAQKLHADDVPLTDCSVTTGLTAIVPLVAFTSDNGSTKVLPGSHRRADLQRLSGNLDSHVDEIRLLGDAGDVFIFSRNLLHSGTRNNSDAPRPALQICWS